MNRIAALLFITAGAVASSTAWASSVTYTFTQNGFSDNNGDAGALTGSFVATPEANGTIQTADVSSFTATFHETAAGGAGAGKVDSFVFNVLNDLSFNTAVPSSLEFSSGSLGSGIVLCSGGGDVNGVCVQSSSPRHPALDASGFFEDLPDFGESLTKQAAIVTVPVSQAPEPSTLAVFAAGLGLLACGSLRGRLLRARTRNN